MRDIIRLLTASMLMISAANATIVKSVSLMEMAKQADAIVQGVISKQEVSWDEARTRIYTLTTIQVSEALKGKVDSAQTLKVRQIGGTIDGITQYVAGNAKFKEREEVIVFLERHPTQGVYFVMGMAQGKYSISRATNPPSVNRSLDGITEVKPGHKLPVLHHKEGPAKAHSNRLSLDLFKASIRDALTP